MRILRVAQNLYPEVPGGGSYHVHAMSRDQAAMGHDVTVLTVSDDESLPRREERDGYTIVRRSATVELLNNEISLGIARFTDSGQLRRDPRSLSPLLLHESGGVEPGTGWRSAGDY